MHNKIPIALVVVLTASILLGSSSVYANDATSSATVLNAAPTMAIELAPDDNPAAPGVQVINPSWETQNRTVTITATVTDMNGWDDLTGTVTAEITGPSTVNDSPVSLTFDNEISVTTAVYTGVFNMSAHTEGDYTIEVTASDAGGLSGNGSENFTYLHTAGDVTPPDVTGPVADPDSITADGVEESELSVNVTDASGIYAVTIDLSPIGGDSAQLMTKINGTDTYTTTTTAATGMTVGMYGLPVTATDDSSNRNTNNDVSILLTVMPNEIVTTYDFTTGAGSDKWAFRKQHYARPPADNDDPNNDFTADQYEPIKVDDGTMREDASAAKRFYAIHRFNFNIAEPEEAITQIDILWDGRGEHDWGTDGATLYIWNFSAGEYEQLNRGTGVYITLEGSVTADIGNYISPDGNLIIIAEQNRPQWKLWRWSYHSRLSTDYVKVEVTYTPKPYLTILDVTPGAAAVHPGDSMQDRYKEANLFEVVS
ncbi:MAG: hypothetical protein ANIMEMIM_00156 [Candidatus Argoarchaeum ethanivorans]|uniref:Uncharacterized protein n=1 Tax=Candidatus Argoarchaeum ethanivorans TaxID=2608793 RepID=A0A811T2R1_9EURY|nr:MAG: hypothetical protein ANIMEMIM_00156 [Candidatus Argoarchaeum ethanivorans]